MSISSFLEKFVLRGEKYLLTVNKHEIPVFFKYKKESKETTEYVVNTEDIAIVEYLDELKDGIAVTLKTTSESLAGKILTKYGRNEIWVIHAEVKNN